MKWSCYNPKFESDESQNDLESHWGGHRYFAYDLILNIEPKIIVELGTEKGTSFFSFCQAIKDASLKTGLYAVDTWQGDKHTGSYGSEISENFKNIAAANYSSVNYTLLHETFDDAVGKFDDQSIDLLHIDGYHTYEAVKHDFETWNRKVKDDGIILFHDISEKILDFGVYKLWDELKASYGTFEFSHSNGLGVLFKNADIYKYILDFDDIWKNYYFLKYTVNLLEHRSITEIQSPKNLNKDMDIDIIKHRSIIRQKEDIIHEKENLIQEKEKIIHGKENIILNNANTIQEKENIIMEKDKVILEKNNIIQEKEKVIQESVNLIQVKENIILQKDSIILNNANTIQEKENNIAEKENIIRGNYNTIVGKDKEIQNKNRIIHELLASKSWKVTKPLRFVSNIIKSRIKIDSK